MSKQPDNGSKGRKRGKKKVVKGNAGRGVKSKKEKVVRRGMKVEGRGRQR